MKRKVGIIGPGISGLVSCKSVQAKGSSPIVFEAKSSIEGAWTQTLETTKLPIHCFSSRIFRGHLV